MYKQDLALNNLQWLISHKTKPNNPELLSLFISHNKIQVISFEYASILIIRNCLPVFYR